MSSQIKRLLKATEELAYHHEKLAVLEQEIKENGPQVEQIAQAVATRFLVDALGRPVNGGVYWYSGQAIVRVGDVVTIIPMNAMNEEKVFEPEPAQNGGHGEPDFVTVVLKEEAEAQAQEDEDEENVAFVLETGLTIYHVLHDDCLSENWYTVDPGNNDLDNDDDTGTMFDVRDITIANPVVEFPTPAEAMTHAVKMGWLTEQGLKVPEESDAGQD